MVFLLPFPLFSLSNSQFRARGELVLVVAYRKMGLGDNALASLFPSPSLLLPAPFASKKSEVTVDGNRFGHTCALGSFYVQ